MPSHIQTEQPAGCDASIADVCFSIPAIKVSWGIWPVIVIEEAKAPIVSVAKELADAIDLVIVAAFGESDKLVISVCA